ncbi:annexin A6-like [Rhopilema esculentum]|uniref:annexin A6-like n=1 Tax=Rhopilema esculentum TaxID=499914 RepID=UPI0031DE63F9
MSSLKQRSAPKFQPSSILLDKRWKEHDYLLHTYRLKVLQGQPTSIPKYQPFPESPRYGRASELEMISSRKEIEAKPKMFVERNTKSAKSDRKRIDVYVRPAASAGPGQRSRPQSKTKNEISTSRSNAMSTPGRKNPKPPQRDKWTGTTTRRSDYSLSAQNDHWKKHLYYREVILGRRVKKSPRRIKPKPEPEPESSEDEIEEELDNINGPSNPHSIKPPIPPRNDPTPDPQDPMEVDDEYEEDDESNRNMRIPKRPSLKPKDFIPPSQQLKIVRDAEPSSDSSWSDSDSDGGPNLILRDGKPGQKYVLRGKKHRRRRGSISEGFDSTDSEDDEMILTKQYLKKPQTPIDFMDTKNDDSSGDSYDEFGRLKKRYKRPDSAAGEEILPPLVIEPCDFGDVNHTKARLEKDTIIIREALVKTPEPDLEVVVDTIIGHKNTNRRWIRKMYRDEYLESLLTQVRKLLPADIASVVSYMMLPPAEYDAMCLRDAMKGLQKEPEVLMEILCTRDNEEIAAIKTCYKRRYAEDLMDDLEDETTGSFQRMLLTLAVANRAIDGGEPNKEESLVTAKALFAILGVAGDQMERKFTEVFGKLGYATLRTILSEYRKFKHHDLENDVINHFTGNMRRCLLTIIQYIQNPPGYFVEKLHGTHYGGLDDDKTITRIMISRQDRDYKMIKELFKLRYDMDLFDYIKNTCHSTQRGLMMRIIAGLLPAEQRKLLMSKVPKLVVPADMVTFNKRLSLNDAITIILRKIQVSSTLLKSLNLRRERIAKLEEESVVELELDYEEDEDEDVAPKPKEEENSDGEGGGKEDQEELRNNLKNLDFKDADDEGGEKKKSVLANVSFSTAARGMNRQENRVKFKGETDGSDNDSGSASGSYRRGSVKSHSLPQPVQDPSFIGRRDSNFFEKVVPFIKGRRKKYYRGTIQGIPMDEFNALKDAQAIGRAMLQKTRNVDGILKFIISRNNAQRQLIVREFFRRYRRDLVDDLRFLTGPEMEDFILGLMLAPEVYDSSGIFEIWNSKQEVGEEDENSEALTDAMTEILCTRGNDEINVIKRAYQGIFGRDLQEDIEQVTSGWIRFLFNRIMKCDRDEGDIVDDKLAQKDASKLFEAHSRKDQDYDVYIDILTSRNSAHLNATFQHFAKITGSDILEYLEADISGDFLEALTAIICNSRDAPMYFCERIYQAMAFHPMDVKMLVRCILTRAECDLNDIKATFRRTYGRSLYNMVEKECIGKYKTYLLDVIGKGNNGKKKRSRIWSKMK